MNRVVNATRALFWKRQTRLDALDHLQMALRVTIVDLHAQARGKSNQLALPSASTLHMT